MAGVALLLREGRGESASSLPGGDLGLVCQPRSEAVRWVGVWMIGPVNLVGLYVIVHAQLTPGGGFQGGAILGTGSLLAYLASRYKTYRRVVPKALVDAAEALGLGCTPRSASRRSRRGGVPRKPPAAGRDQGSPLGAAGTIPVINLGVGLEITAGFTILFQEFLEETRASRPEDHHP